MKKETIRAINEFVEFMDEVNGDLPDWPTIKNILLKLPEMEGTLANGGLIRDDQGNWCCSGTPVKVWDMAGREFWSVGRVVFDPWNMSWMLKVDDDSYSLGKGGDGVEFTKMTDQSESLH